MYQQFGALVDQAAKTITFTLFVPDGERAPTQYEGGGLPRLKDVAAVGSFQAAPWDPATAVPMPPTDLFDPPGLLKGVAYTATLGPLADGFYEYKYLVTFENGQQRYLTDPCGRYGGSRDQNSGFVVGGGLDRAKPLKKRLPLNDLVVYELMIDDFTSHIRQPNEAPLQTIVSKLDYLASLGINAIEFMPWTAWAYPQAPNQDFSWGYNPIQYYSVAHKYTLNTSNDTDKLVYLTRLINECHARDIHVIMDGVFNHADAFPPDRGFPCYWLYEDPADSPYVGNFAQAAFFQDLDYANQCTLEYIRDACIYWIEEFKIDGIRFDNTLGLYRPGDRGHGLPKLLSELRGYLSRNGIENFSMIMEHSWDYDAIDVVNKVGATSCWLDRFRSDCFHFLGDRPQGVPQIEPSIMRLLDAGRDFGPGHVPTVYIENHDHARIMRKAGTRPFWYLTQPYAIALFTSPGATLIYNGQEFGMDNDMPEDGPDRVRARPLDWSLLATPPGPQLVDLYHRLIAIRQAHPGLRSSNFYPSGWGDGTQLDPHGFGIDRARNVVVYHRWGLDDAGRLERLYVVLNFSQHTQTVSFRVSDGLWQELLGGGSATPSNGWLTVDVGSNWGGIYCQPSV